MKSEPVQEHRWLRRLLGEWSFEHECPGGPDQPPVKSRGTEAVRAIGDLWVVAEGQGTMPDGSPATMVLTLGYDPRKGRFVGTWTGSMMTHLWVYDGELDAGRNRLALYADGPSFTDPTKTARYCDAIEFLADDHRTLTSSVLGEDGNWTTFMTAHYRRTK
ncbi:MAG TPA: DUF1579 domain-containing protein [Planctomycetaceae bacterium]